MTPAAGTRAPRIAVLAGREPASRYSLHRGYVDAVWATGATPYVVVPGLARDPEAALAALELADAVLLTGGGDVAGERYGADPDAMVLEVDPARDALETAAVHWALATGRPLLGICRGLQVLNVALGGTLVTDLPEAGHPGHWAMDREGEPVHGIWAEPGSAAQAALGGADRVNSIHHQAVLTPGAGLRVTARSPDGVVEAVERTGLLGVQWHPERLVATDPRHLAPFAWLVAQTRASEDQPAQARAGADQPVPA